MLIVAIVAPIVVILLLTLFVCWIIFERKRIKFNSVPQESGMV